MHDLHQPQNVGVGQVGPLEALGLVHLLDRAGTKAPQGAQGDPSSAGVGLGIVLLGMSRSSRTNESLRPCRQVCLRTFCLDERSNWWNSADVARFKALTSRLAGQYSRYEAIPGAYVNGEMTLSENIGDLGGLGIALEAYHFSLHGQPAPLLDGTSGDQRFFLSWAQTYRENIREQALRANLAADPHSPAVFRVNGVVRNIGAWYEAFGVKKGDRLYLEPGDRISIW